MLINSLCQCTFSPTKANARMTLRLSRSRIKTIVISDPDILYFLQQAFFVDRNFFTLVNKHITLENEQQLIVNSLGKSKVELVSTYIHKEKHQSQRVKVK